MVYLPCIYRVSTHTHTKQATVCVERNNVGGVSVFVCVCVCMCVYVFECVCGCFWSLCVCVLGRVHLNEQLNAQCAYPTVLRAPQLCMYPPPESMYLYLDAPRRASVTNRRVCVYVVISLFVWTSIGRFGTGSGGMGNGGGQDETPVIEEEDAFAVSKI